MRNLKKKKWIIIAMVVNEGENKVNFELYFI